MVKKEGLEVMEDLREELQRLVRRMEEPLPLAVFLNSFEKGEAREFGLQCYFKRIILNSAEGRPPPFKIFEGQALQGAGVRELLGWLAERV